MNNAVNLIDPLGLWEGSGGYYDPYTATVQPPTFTPQPPTLGGGFTPDELECIANKLAQFFGVPFIGVTGPFAGMAKTGAMTAIGVYMTGGGVVVTGAGAVMAAGGTVSGGTGFVAGAATMAAGASITTSGAALTAIGADLFGDELHHALDIFSKDCKCDPTIQCCNQ